MKFTTIAVAILAFILGVQSHTFQTGLLSPLLGLGLNGLNLGLNPLGVAPVGLGINGLGLAVGGSNGLGLNHHLAGLWNLHNLGWGRRSGDLGVVDGGIYPYGYGNSLSQGSAILAAPTTAGHNVDLTGYGAISGHGATYVAKTRGSVHTAPLDGHTSSVASVNVASAPGTF
ncbi:uncharacterized protein LOC129949493 [Eupeodes corollae]|uniref:uncharacterized protein LOC129949493 n=1 Tax=Eupeodes corollae TaxID=290404 RepID=UPI00249218C8|nr:uncharacterized protein LOC129949493 [Eupeodes corollae]